MENNKDFLKYEAMRYKRDLEALAYKMGLKTKQTQGYNLNGKVLLIEGFPYAVWTNKDSKVVFIKGIVEDADVTQDIAYQLYLLGLTREDINGTEIPRLINIKDVEGMNFKSFRERFKIDMEG